MIKNLLVFTFIGFLTIAQNIYAISELPQTGQSQAETKTDDGELELGKKWPVPRFTDNRDGTLTDHLTGLMWIKHAYCASHFISGAATSNWHESINFSATLNDHSLATPCNEYTANYEDWRSPNINELSSLVRAGLTDGTSISEWLYLPDDESGAFFEIGIVQNPIWTSTSVAGNPNQAWIINLKTGELSTKEKSLDNELAFIFSAVRSTTDPFYLASGQSTRYIDNDDGDLQFGIKLPTPRFVATEFGTVIDKLTGLLWVQDANCATPEGGTWISASNSIHPGLVTTAFFISCTNYTPSIIDNRDETWRIPNINELRSLIDYGQNEPALDANHPFTLLTDKVFWSSTSANNTPQTAAWTVSLQSGKIFPQKDKAEIAYTWPVRGPVDFPDISVSHSAIHFNSLFVNSESSDQTMTIQNTGQLGLAVSLIQITDINGQAINGPFSIGKDLCSERILDADIKCSIVINFTPNSAADLQAFISIKSNALGINQLSIPVTGSGLVATSTEKNSANCFIATAAYGSFLEPEVKTLRTFRDNVLLQYNWGKYLVNYYYDFSPPLANFIAERAYLRVITRLILTPIVYGVKYPGIILIILLSLLTVVFKKRMYRYQQFKTIRGSLRTK